jgi:hypothetical protein
VEPQSTALTTWLRSPHTFPSIAQNEWLATGFLSSIRAMVRVSE